jgi:predicted phage terminase large subunit-like protein
MVFMPPRHGKSELVSKYFTAWYLGTFPDRRVILTSYEADFAAQWGRRAREVVEEWGNLIFFEKVEVMPDSSSASRWDITGHTGGMATAGVGGPITGKGGDLIIIDDPVKNDEQAMSETYKERSYEWYKATLSTRLEPHGAIILIMTRWNEDDLAGKLIEEMKAGGEKWEIINFPALAEDNDPLGRPVGSPLWPERFDLDAINATKRRVGTYWFAALYQQRPAPEEGELIKRKWWKFYKTRPDGLELAQSWDCAFKDLKTSSNVCGQVWGRTGASFYLLDEVCDKMDLPATLKAVQSLTAKWPKTIAKYVEDKANGPAVIQMLKNRIPGLIAVEPEGGKIVRVHAVTPVIEAGNVHLPDPSIAPWIHDFIQECSAFPNGKYSDRVDAMSQLLSRWAVTIRNTANEPTVEQAVAAATEDDDFGFSGSADDELGDLFG